MLPVDGDNLVAEERLGENSIVLRAEDAHYAVENGFVYCVYVEAVQDTANMVSLCFIDLYHLL